MKEILDKLNEIEVKAQEYHDKDDVFNMTYCMGQINILRWMIDHLCKGIEVTGGLECTVFHIHPSDIDSIQAGHPEEER